MANEPLITAVFKSTGSHGRNVKLYADSKPQINVNNKQTRVTSPKLHSFPATSTEVTSVCWKKKNILKNIKIYNLLNKRSELMIACSSKKKIKWL